MRRDYDKEIDALKERLENLQNMVSPQLDELRDMMMELLPSKSATEKLKRVHVMHGMHPIVVSVIWWTKPTHREHGKLMGRIRSRKEGCC